MTPLGKLSILGGIAAIWGYTKNRRVGAEVAVGNCASANAELRAHNLSPAHLLRTCLYGPAIEEVLYRSTLNRSLSTLAGGHPLLGTLLGSLSFGMAHHRPLGALPDGVNNAALAVDAFAGGLLFSAAYVLGGLPAAIACHGLHNLACEIGFVNGVASTKPVLRLPAPKARPPLP